MHEPSGVASIRVIIRYSRFPTIFHCKDPTFKNILPFNARGILWESFREVTVKRSRADVGVTPGIEIVPSPSVCEANQGDFTVISSKKWLHLRLNYWKGATNRNRNSGKRILLLGIYIWSLCQRQLCVKCRINCPVVFAWLNERQAVRHHIIR